VTALQLSCVIFYGFWRFFDEYYFYKKTAVKGCFKLNYVKVVLMTYLIAIASKLFPLFIGIGITVFFLFVIACLLLGGIKVIREYERLVIFRLGKCSALGSANPRGTKLGSCASLNA